jgi:hypothetical protein
MDNDKELQKRLNELKRGLATEERRAEQSAGFFLNQIVYSSIYVMEREIAEIESTLNLKK